MYGIKISGDKINIINWKVKSHQSVLLYGKRLQMNNRLQSSYFLPFLYPFVSYSVLLFFLLIWKVSNPHTCHKVDKFLELYGIYSEIVVLLQKYEICLKTSHFSGFKIFFSKIQHFRIILETILMALI